MRLYFALMFLTLLCTIVVQAGDDSKKDQQALQGTWRVVETTGSGEKLPKSDVDKVTFVFDGEKWFQKIGDTIDNKGVFQVHAGKKPKAIDLVNEKGATLLGIYTLEGKTLKICASLPVEKVAQKRPSEFSSTKENGCMLIILERTI
ncbi:MAG TPA: TIGR03067 domain-containing protein [Pirellulaceae bacterium]|nr:TIGR03067 domain-containing protein [Pirellulaceae bacterium]